MQYELILKMKVVEEKEIKELVKKLKIFNGDIEKVQILQANKIIN